MTYSNLFGIKGKVILDVLRESEEDLTSNEITDRANRILSLESSCISSFELRQLIRQYVMNGKVVIKGYDEKKRFKTYAFNRNQI